MFLWFQFFFSSGFFYNDHLVVVVVVACIWPLLNDLWPSDDRFCPYYYFNTKWKFFFLKTKKRKILHQSCSLSLIFIFSNRMKYCCCCCYVMTNDNFIVVFFCSQSLVFFMIENGHTHTQNKPGKQVLFFQKKRSPRTISLTTK